MKRKDKRGIQVQPKPWTCSLCEKEQSPEETKTKVVLCPTCFAEFQIFKQSFMESSQRHQQHAQDFQRTLV